MRQNVSYCVLYCLLCAAAWAGPGNADRNRQAVAECGPLRITLKEFRIAYLDYIKGPRNFDSPRTREEFLDAMIAARFLAEEGRRQGLEKSPILQARVEAYKGRCLRDEHYRVVIRPKIHVSEPDIEEAYQYTQEKRRLQHLFFKTKQEADSMASMLRQGLRFEDATMTVFRDTALANSGGDLGWVEWDQLDYDLAMTAFRMKVDSISPPVQSIYGWHILRVTGYQKNPMITRTQYELHRRKAKTLLEGKIGDRLMDGYLKNMYAHASVKLIPRTAEFAAEKLKGLFSRKPTLADGMTPAQVTESELQSVEMTLWDARNETLAILNGRTMTIGDLIGHIIYIPYSALHAGFKTTLDYAFRDFLLTQESKAMGLEKRENVRMKTDLYRESIVQLQVRRNEVARVAVSEDEVRERYAREQRALHNAPYDSVRAPLREQVLIEKRQAAVPALVKRLTKGKPIVKHMDILNAYYEGVLAGKHADDGI